jgi:hypothetical protein
MSVNKISTNRKHHFNQLKILITGIISILILSLLLYQYFYSKVPSHAIMQRKDMPEISNWWGAILLPLFTWFTMGRIERQLNEEERGTEQYRKIMYNVIFRFVVALLLGTAIAFAFTYDYKVFLDNVPYLLLFFALLLPIYFSEFILGFVIGMTYTLGAVLPFAFILVFAGVGFILFKSSRFVLSKLIKA